MRTLAPLSRVPVALFVVALARGAAAADWYVDAAAPAGGDGTQTKPLTTINAAVAKLARGDTLWVAGGTYDEVVNLTKLPGSGGTTTLRAMPGATPVIDGTSGSAAAGFVVQTSVPDTTLQGLTIQNAKGGALGVQFYYADGGRVDHCVTKNMSGNAVTFYYANHGTVTGSKLQGNVAGRQTTGTVVENNEVYGASAEGVGLYDGSTECTVAHNVIHDNYSVNLYLDSISHSTFDGNLVYESSPDNDLEGIEISDEGHYADLPAPVNSYNTIVNNVIVGHALGIVFWYSGEWKTQALNDQSGLRHDVIANNTLVNNKGSFKWDASPAHVGTAIENNLVYAAAGSSSIYLVQAKAANGITLDHNLWYAPDLPQPFLWLGEQTDHAGYVAASTQGGGDVVADPLLVGPLSVPPATNLALTKASPALGAGVSLPAVVTDFLSAARPTAGVDIGAFQYGAKAAAGAGGAGTPTGAGGGTGTTTGAGGSDLTGAGGNGSDGTSGMAGASGAAGTETTGGTGGATNAGAAGAAEATNGGGADDSSSGCSLSVRPHAGATAFVLACLLGARKRQRCR